MINVDVDVENLPGLRAPGISQQKRLNNERDYERQNRKVETKSSTMRPLDETLLVVQAQNLVAKSKNWKILTTGSNIILTVKIYLAMKVEVFKLYFEDLFVSCLRNCKLHYYTS